MKRKRRSLLLSAALVTLVILVILAVPVLAQEAPGEETHQGQETATPPPAEKQEEDSTLFYPAFRNIDVIQLNENQMALLMINNQIEYLMLQIREKENQLKEKDRQISILNAGFEERLAEARNEQTALKAEHAKEINEMEAKIAAKEAEVEAGRQELHALEKKVAAFLGDSGLYLVALLAALAGLILGLILSAIFGRRRNVSGAGSGSKSA